MKKNVNVEKINNDTWVVSEGKGRGRTHSYLLTGEAAAAVIDTGLGLTDLKKETEKLTKKEVMVINTHGHLDHVSRNYQFQKVYLHPRDEGLYFDGINYEKRKKLYSERFVGKGVPEWLVNSIFFRPILDPVCRLPQKKDYLPLKDGMTIDLGNRELRVIETPGHTQGSVCILDEKNRMLFTGDTLCEQGVLLNFVHSADLKTYSESLKKLKAVSGKYDFLYPGHQNLPLDKEYVDDFIECVTAIEDKKSKDTEKDGTFVSAYKRAVITHSVTNRRDLFG